LIFFLNSLKLSIQARAFCVKRTIDSNDKTPEESNSPNAKCQTLRASPSTKQDLDIMNRKDALVCFIRELMEVEAAADPEVINCLKSYLVDVFQRVSDFVL
jgi:hypothetical protein